MLHVQLHLIASNFHQFCVYLIMSNSITLFRVLMAIIMGSLMIGQLAALSPDFGKGRIGAAHLFKLFSKIPVIDSASEKGVKPVRL